MFNKYYLFFCSAFKSKSDKEIFLSSPIAIAYYSFICCVNMLVSRQVITGTKSLREKKLWKKIKLNLVIIFCMQIAERHCYYVSYAESIYPLQVEES